MMVCVCVKERMCRGHGLPLVWADGRARPPLTRAAPGLPAPLNANQRGPVDATEIM